MLTTRISSMDISSAKRENYTAQQMARGFATYGVHIMNEVRKTSPDVSVTLLKNHAYIIACSEYTMSLASVINFNLYIPDGFSNAVTMMDSIKRLIDRYYRR